MGIKRWTIKRIMKAWDKHDHKILANQSFPDGVTEISDIPYMADGKQGHLLDFYHPQEPGQKLPIIIDIHGGGFFYGDKELNRSFCGHLAQRGFVVFNINYRLAPDETKVTGQIQDVMAAIHWIGDNLEKYPADQERAFIIGDSAGGVLAVLAALIAQHQRLQTIFDAEKPELQFKAISVICGMMDFDKEAFLYRGIRSVCFDKDYENQATYQNMIFNRIPEMKDLPPVFLTTSDQDALRSMTLSFEKTLKKYNVAYQLKHCPKVDGKKLGHIFPVQYPEYEESQALFDEMIQFFQAVSRAKP